MIISSSTDRDRVDTRGVIRCIYVCICGYTAQDLQEHVLRRLKSSRYLVVLEGAGSFETLHSATLRRDVSKMVPANNSNHIEK